MNDELTELMRRQYKVVLRPLPDLDGGGWLVEIPELPGCISDGNTKDEALRNVEDAKLEWFDYALKKGVSIPQPGDYESEVLSYSGKFTTRVPKSLHKRLAEKAQEEGVSLNQLVNNLLSSGLESRVHKKTGYKVVIESEEPFVIDQPEP